MTQLARYLEHPIVHTVELLDWATGGPKPPCPARRHAARAPARRADQDRSSRQYRYLVRTKPARTIMPTRVRIFFNEIAAAIGGDAVNRSEETLSRYGENTMPGGDRRPAGVVYPASTADVQKIVRSANAHGVPLYPISTGNNIGLGSRSASGAGQVVVDLGHRMNRILEVDERLGFAVVEPGVSYQAMYDELVRRGNKLMLDVTSGPPQGGMIGNALDKGAGYTPYSIISAFPAAWRSCLAMARSCAPATDRSTMTAW